MANALITGGAGFIGSHLVERLIKEGWTVGVLDNLSTGSWDNLELAQGPSLIAKTWDVSVPWPTEKFDIKWDVVVHLASPASPIHYQRLSLETLRVNSRGTENAIEAALRDGARFVYGSTSETYGDPEVSPQPETYWGRVNPIGPRACYDESKRYGEALTMEYWRRTAIDARIIRFFNCYGPRMQLDDGRVVPNFIRQALLGEPLTVYGDGSQTRSFCYVSDTVEAIYRMMTGSKLAGHVINIGNPWEMTIREFAQAVSAAIEVPLQIEYRPLPQDDPTQRRPDIQKAEQLLGWRPVVDLPEGLIKTIRYFRSRVR